MIFHYETMITDVECVGCRKTLSDSPTQSAKSMRCLGVVIHA